MSEQLSIDDIYNSKSCGGSVFKAVVMMAQEARFINEQSNMGFIKLTKKPTTIAMSKFKMEKLESFEKADKKRALSAVTPMDYTGEEEEEEVEIVEDEFDETEEAATIQE
jgi:hypothetical protein